MRAYSLVDRGLLHVDRVLRTLAAQPRSLRPTPGADMPEADLSEAERRHTAALMRINHVGEVCAQALYQGQALTARTDHAKKLLDDAAYEELEHLAWTSERVHELGGRTSCLNPVWYGGALSLGVVAGIAGDRWSLGFLAETERQVEAHLGRHLDELSSRDVRTRQILDQMQRDEAEHARTALNLGARELPAPLRAAMKVAARVMTTLAYRI